MALVVLAPSSSSAASQQEQQTLVFDLVGRATSFVDTAPSGPSPGDTENISARLRDAAGRFVGTARTTCIFTKVIPDDVLENCSASGKTTDGTLKLAGEGHLKSMNPPWPLISGTGAYKGAQGQLVFETDIPVDPNVPLAAGRLFTVVVFELAGNRRFHAGVVERPAANAAFVQRVNAVCNATKARSVQLPGFPFPTFDPFHPDKALLPRVGRYFDQGTRHRLPQELLTQLERLGPPPRDGSPWQNVLNARRSVLKAEAVQIKAALAGNASAFVRTVYEQAAVYNRLVFTSAVFGVQSCTFG
jgi:hypothetical protein